MWHIPVAHQYELNAPQDSAYFCLVVGLYLLPLWPSDSCSEALFQYASYCSIMTKLQSIHGSGYVLLVTL